MKKRLKTTDTHDEKNDKSNENEANKNEEIERKGEIYKHVKESKEGDTETLDAATNVSKIYKNCLFLP